MKTLITLAIVLLLIFSIDASEPGQVADRIFINGKVWTAERNEPLAEAFAIHNGVFIAVGKNSDALKFKGSSTEIIDLKGSFVSPGFNDAHLHFLVRDQFMIEESDDLKTIQQGLAAFAKDHPKSEWILGRGWGYGSFPNNKPHKSHLDSIISDRPVLLEERDGHMALVNSKALQVANITRDTPDPEHGRIVHDEEGEPTGELQEAAVDLVDKLIPPAGDDELYVSLKRILDQAASYGITSVQNASFNKRNLPIYDRVISEGGLKVRFYYAVPFRAESTEKDFEEYKALGKRYDPKVFKFGSAKGMLDGVVDAQTAAMFEPYTTGTNGIAMWKQEDLNRIAAIYDKHGFQIMLHAIGDKAIAMALDAYEHVQRVNGKRDSRHRIEHIEVPRLSDLPRFKKLGVIASTQALFANPDQTTLQNYSPLLGPERSSHANAFKLFDDAGAVQAFGSDWPVFSMEVLKGVYCAATRQTPEGTPADGYFPEHRISIEAALRHFTVDSAYASFDEKVKGTLAAGKYADFVVLSENVLEPPATRILKTEVLRTVMGGKDTYLGNSKSANE